jgi:hypothetical protein
MQLNIIHLAKEQFPIDSPLYEASVKREKSFLWEMAEQNIDYKVWDAKYVPNVIGLGCCLSHKAIVRDAKEKGLKQVAIAEDDIVFSSKRAWSYFLEQMPTDFDFYMGVSYSTLTYPTNVVQHAFYSMSLYVIKETIYDILLAAPEGELKNIDVYLNEFIDTHKFRICQPYVCKQLEGYSFNYSQDRLLDHFLAGKVLYGT